MNKEKRLLFVDLRSTGHHSEFIDHLVKAKAYYEKEHKISFFFLLSPDILNYHPEYKNNDSFIFISQPEYQRYLHAGRMRSSRLLLKYTDRIVSANKIDEVLFLYGNEILPYALIRRFHYSFSYIFFQPPFRETTRTVMSSLKKRWKEWIYFFLVRKKSVIRAFILNDKSCVDSYNRQTGTTKFMLLNDPASSLTDDLKIPVNTVPGQRVVFGHLGSLDHRKGTLEFLDAIGGLSRENVRNSKFIIAGKASDNFHERIAEEIEQLQKKNSEISIEYIPGFFNDTLFQEVFMKCDSIVLPYSNPQASSGLVGKAIIFKKHLICPASGLIGELAETYGYCNVYDTSDGLGTCMESFIKGSYREINEPFRKKFIEQSAPGNFVSTLILQDGN